MTCVCIAVYTQSSLGFKKCCYILLCIQRRSTHTHTHTLCTYVCTCTLAYTGNERRDRRVAASIQFQRGDAIIFKVGDKEMEGEIANLYVSPGCHLVRCYKIREILFQFFPIYSITGFYVQER